jgi:hypothetical protein
MAQEPTVYRGIRIAVGTVARRLSCGKCRVIIHGAGRVGSGCARYEYVLAP